MARPFSSSRRTSRSEGTDFDSLERIASILDDFIRIPGIGLRIGLDPIIGMIPWVGDSVTALFSLILIGSAIRYRVPKIVILRMAMYVAFDYFVGIVPVIGDASDFFVKSNRWNMNLLRRYAHDRRRPRFSDYFFVSVVIGSLIALIAGGIVLVIYVFRLLYRMW